MSDALTRRSFLRRSAATGAGVVLVGSTEMLMTTPAEAAEPGYGPLVADPARRLALPRGFRYEIVTHAGVTRLESGEPTPRNHDGTGAFRRPAGGTVLVNNHEIREPYDLRDLPVPHLDGVVYDPGAAGGCTIVEVDAAGRRVTERVGIAGTRTNCAGGVTPWETWLTCEEADSLAGTDGFRRDHGYVFEVDPHDREANRDPRPIKALGRFEHEAVAVDPQRGDLYLTEDAARPNGLLYRWQAPAGFRPGKGALRNLGPTAGVLAAMKTPVPDLSVVTAIGTALPVTWTPVPDRDARTRAIRTQLADGVVTRGRKLEGAWWGDGGAYIVSSYTRDGDYPGVTRAHDGQVWHYDPERGTLTLKLRFARGGTFDGPDNISLSPYGGLIMAEDGEGAQHLVGVTPGGQTFAMARNDFTDASKGIEFTGPVYSPDGNVLFANVQVPGHLFAITGPWRRLG